MMGSLSVDIWLGHYSSKLPPSANEVSRLGG